jgi:hypothetical protein
MSRPLKSVVKSREVCAQRHAPLGSRWQDTSGHAQAG